jgi:hypothetical protein|tara:strand:- start:66 stop:476 length:411 start_codon:yes stop_codon:yes gene_type:complete
MPKYGKFRTRILAQQKRREENNNDKPLQRNMGVRFTPKTGPNAGEEVMFRMPPFPKLKDVPEDNVGLAKLPEKVRNNMGFKRYKEDEDTGMLRMEELKPLNRMGAVPFQRNEMPMAYKHKAYKPTAKAKAIPFTAK